MLAKLSKIKFHAIPFSGSGVVTLSAVNLTMLSVIQTTNNALNDWMMVNELERIW
jgi:hypothetical protein